MRVAKSQKDSMRSMRAKRFASMKTCQALSLLPRELPSDLTPYLVQPSTREAMVSTTPSLDLKSLYRKGQDVVRYGHVSVIIISSCIAKGCIMTPVRWDEQISGCSKRGGHF